MLTARSSLLERSYEWAEENLRPFGLMAMAIAAATLYLGVVAFAWQHTSYDVWGALLITPLLIALTVPLARRAAVDEKDPTMVRLLLSALVLKLVMSLVRYAVAFGIYGGVADAAVYHAWGTDLSRMFRSGDLRTLGEPLQGTGFIRILTGAIYTVTGPTKIGGFVIYAWLGFWGLYFFYRAFRLAVPDGDHRRYALLVFFLPSMLFWPSSIGKEAWMCLMLGISAYGAAKILRARRGGFVLVTIGLAGAAVVRPHVALLFFVGLAIAYVLRRPRRRSVLGPISKIAGVLALVAVGVFLLGRVEEYFGAAGIEDGGVTAALDLATDRTGDIGGSTFTTVRPTSPGRFAWAVITVLFRPFPQEAGNLQSLLAAAEGTALLGLCLVSVPRAMRLFTKLRSRPYPVLALTYVLLFCYAFASIGNFGILTRQRVQVLPFLLVLLCLPRRTVTAPEPFVRAG